MKAEILAMKGWQQFIKAAENDASMQPADFRSFGTYVGNLVSENINANAEVVTVRISDYVSDQVDRRRLLRIF